MHMNFVCGSNALAIELLVGVLAALMTAAMARVKLCSIELCSDNFSLGFCPGVYCL
jgi:hypothetical protein